MNTENTDKVIFKVVSSENKAGSKNGRDWVAKNVWGEILPESPFKSNLQLNTMIFGKGSDFPTGLEEGCKVVMDIDELRISKRKINLIGEVLPH